MATSISTFLSLISFFLLLSSSSPLSIRDSLRQCISEKVQPIPVNSVLHFPSDPSYEPIMESDVQNLRFLTQSYPKPLAIITPSNYSHVQTAVLCAKKNGLRIRVRSGGHDYEGMSYTSRCGAPVFVVVDLINLTSVTVDVEGEKKTATVQAGATLGQLYYWINNGTQQYGFAGGICPTVGVGGLISGGGFGHMTRKYGLSLDNVIDAKLVDVNGQFHDKVSTEKDLFWAIRGGGAASFGIVVEWTLQLVPVPPNVTVFNVSRSFSQETIQLIQTSQLASYDMDENLRMRVEISTDNGTTTAKFSSMYLGTADELVQSMEKSLPALNLTKNDCKEMSWIDSVMYFSDYPAGEPIEALRDRKPQPKIHFKAKSDFVVTPVSKDVIAELWSRCSQKIDFHLVMHSYGGRMREIPEDQTPFPFRNGTLYGIEYMMAWNETDTETARVNINWVRSLYEYMTPYVSKNPRGAYSNFRDYELGTNYDSEPTDKWGFNYFKSNFYRLKAVKRSVDPENYFAYEQSIPPERIIQRRRKGRKFSPAIAAV